MAMGRKNTSFTLTLAAKATYYSQIRLLSPPVCPHIHKGPASEIPLLL